MRRRRSRSVRAALAVASTAVLLGALARPAGAQSGIAKEGALFLLVPIGARAVGEGGAAVAGRLGAEGIWWNPASIGWAEHREVAIDNAQNAFISGTAADIVIPAGRAGVLAVSLLYFDLGTQAATDEFGTTVGTLYPRDVVIAGTYAATFGSRVSAGITYKLIQAAQTCSGACPNQVVYSSSTSAFDFGVHAVVDSARRLTFGAAIRNAGFGLQTIDREQTDPLPARVNVGADYAFGSVSPSLPGATWHASAEMVTRIDLTNPAFRVGAELSLAERVFVRAGVVNDKSASGDGSTASFGIGFRQGTLGLDLARTFGGESADAGKPPTYITIRFGFR